MSQPHTIFLVHGMGLFEDKWEKEFIAPIKSAYNAYPKLAKKKFEERFEFVAISYDKIFRDLLKTWADTAAIVAQLSAQFGAPLPEQLTRWLQNAGDLKNNFNWSHATDVLLYRGIRLVREHVCTSVAKTIVDTIKKQYDDWGLSSWSLIAHSLGTAVAHDTLARMSVPNQDWPGELAFEAGSNEQASVVMMVANVSKVLEVSTPEEPYDAYGPVIDGKKRFTVAPGDAGQKGRLCQYYLNVRHKIDPFCIPHRFDPQQWPDKAALAEDPPLYQHLEVDHIHQANVHDFAHYLKNPRVHVPLLRCLVSPAHISKTEYENTVAAFPDFGIAQSRAIELKKKLLDIPASAADEWWILGLLWQMFVNATGDKP